MKFSLPLLTDFITFNSPLSEEIIHDCFVIAHKSCSSKHTYWSLAATRKKIISRFWCRQVPLHFVALIGTAMLFSFPFSQNRPLYFFCLMVASMLSFVILFFIIYLPSYYSIFFPVLDNIINEQEKTLATEEETKKCRRTQFSGPTLIVIYYALFKTGSIPLLPCNDGSAGLLNNLFGLDRGMLKQNMARLHKIGSLSTKERAEFQKGIDNARKVFTEAGSEKALSIIGQLEQKLLHGLGQPV